MVLGGLTVEALGPQVLYGGGDYGFLPLHSLMHKVQTLFVNIDSSAISGSQKNVMVNWCHYLEPWIETYYFSGRFFHHLITPRSSLPLDLCASASNFELSPSWSIFWRLDLG